MQPIFNTNQISLYQGCCLEVMPLLPDHSINFILCDLPYQQVNCEWDVLIPFEPLWEQYKRLIKPNGAIALFGSQPFTTDLIMSNRKWFKYEWIWDKTQATGHLNANRRPMKSHETIAIFGQSIPYFPQLSAKLNQNIRPAWRGSQSDCYGSFDPGHPRTIPVDVSYPKTILKFANETGLHSTQKPVALLEYLIRTYTTEGETVLDNTCGSGSTLVAARDTGRKAIGIEKDPKYCQIAIERCSQLSIFEQAV